MSHTDPKPRDSAKADGPKFRWAVTGLETIKWVDLDLSESLGSILANRRTARSASAAPLPLVASVVRTALKIQDAGIDANAGRYRKAVISAGALHVIDAVIFTGNAEAPALLYDDDCDALIALTVEDPQKLRIEVQNARALLPCFEGHLILFVADRERADASYENADSLIWRDSGAILQGLAMIAQAQQLKCCPLGPLGNECLKAIVGEQHRMMAVGFVMLGNPADRKLADI